MYIAEIGRKIKEFHLATFEVAFPMSYFEIHHIHSFVSLTDEVYEPGLKSNYCFHLCDRNIKSAAVDH